MTYFDQRGQQNYGQQQNAVGDIHNSNQSLAFGTVQRIADLPPLLKQLQTVVTEATEDGRLPKKVGIDAKAAVEKAVVEAEEPHPDKKNLLDYLTATKSLIEGVTAATGLIPTVAAAIEAVHRVM